MRALDDRLDWQRDGRDWPNRDYSRFVTAGGLTWHVQSAGDGPALLLIHGTGSSTHSWRRLFPLLAERFSVLAIDLPGHGFTTAPAAHRLSLSGMAGAVANLLATLKMTPDVAVGHSAGAAILARLCLDRAINPKFIVSLNGAFLPFGGIAGKVFSPLAKVLATTSLAPNIFAARASNRAVIDRLIGETGSVIEDEDAACYWRLARSPGHVAAALAMMANWDLSTLLTEMRLLPVPLDLVVGERDKTVLPSVAARVKKEAPEARIVTLPGLGHLAHEESPGLIFSHIEKRYQQITD